MTDENVEIVHPQYPGVVSTVSRGAYERRSRKLGWRIASGEATRPPDPLARYRNTGDEPEAPTGSFVEHQERAVANKAELLERARALGIEGVDGRTSVRKLTEAIAAREDSE